MEVANFDGIGNRGVANRISLAMRISSADAAAGAPVGVHVAPLSTRPQRPMGYPKGILLDGRYLLQAPIAIGGMSTVYRGLDTRLDRSVAVKVMDARYAGDQQFLTRFRMEARAAARLSDPGLVAVFDQGMDARHPYLVMELVEGGTLRELLRERGPMPPHAVVAVLRPVLRGLAVAHRGGLVHRDLKPENVLISDRGEVKLADLSLASRLSQEPQRALDPTLQEGTARQKSAPRRRYLS